MLLSRQEVIANRERIMARRNVHSGPTLADNPAAPERTSGPTDTRWFVAFPYVLNDLARRFDRLFVIISVIGLGAIAVAYWGAYTEYYYISAAAVAVLGLALLVWTIATVRMLWVVANGVVRWRVARRSRAQIRESTESGLE